MDDLEIIDNFLEPDVFNEIQRMVMSRDVPWKYSDHVSSHFDNLDQFYFVHPVFEGFIINSPMFDLLARTLFPKLKLYSLNRMKLNMYTRSEKIIEHGWHTDNVIPHKGAIFYINTCNGYTGIKDQKVYSVENRMLKFDSRLLHHSTSCTDAKVRITLNINYN